LIKKPHLRSQDQWSHSITGSEGANVLKFQGQATIKTVVFRKGCVAVHGELRGKNRFDFKPPLVVPAIAQLHRVMALGHIEEGAREHELSPEPWRTKCAAVVSTDMWHPYDLGAWLHPKN